MTGDNQGFDHLLGLSLEQPLPDEQPGHQQHAADGEEHSEYARRRDLRAERRRQSAKRRKALTAILVTVLVIGVGGFFVMQYTGDVLGLFKARNSSAAAISDYPGPGSGSVEVSVNQGDTGEDIATSLKKAGVIATRQAYLTEAKATPESATIQPGTYALKKQMRAADALIVLVDPANRLDYVLTIPEGWTVAEVSSKVEAVLGVTSEDVTAALEDTAATGLPKKAANKYEGWLSPGQYVFPRDIKVTAVFSEMVTRTVTALDTLKVAKAERQTVLTKASILQREVNPDNFGKVARVIENRIATDMALGMDTTVAYGAGKDVMELTQSDFDDEDNPYNTYQHTGLPPGPIANPSVEAIKAVLDPEAGNWVYFVTVNLDTGETKFTDSFTEFQEYVAEYRAWKEKYYTPTPSADSDS